MSGISTHVLDTALGVPARGVSVSLERRTADGWTLLRSGVTDQSGRIPQLLPDGMPLSGGIYRLVFRVREYFGSRTCFYPEILIEFEITDTSSHYHVPLLLSPYGYTTYRGS